MRGPDSRTLGQLLDEMARVRPDAPALVFEGRTLSYRDLEHEASLVARGLLELGLGRGDKVAVLMGNRPEWIITALATAKAGGVLVAVNTWYYAEEIAYVLGHSEASILVMTDRFERIKRDYSALILEICPELGNERRERLSSPKLPELAHVVRTGPASLPGSWSWDELRERGGAIPHAQLSERQAAVAPEDMFYLLYTSGTTARPKGVPLAHRGLIENGFNIGERQHQTANDRLWLGTPLFFSFASANALMTIITHGGCVVLQEVFDPSEALRIIEQEQCTVYYGMPNMTSALREQASGESRDVSSLRTGATIGASADIQNAIDFGVREICNVYGLTETYGNCAVADAHDPLELRLTTQGMPLPNTEIKIVDLATGARLPAGEKGEICARGYITDGYYKDPELTRSVLDGEGFFHTGDLGCLTEDGRLQYQSRLKDMIKTGGINVAPLEVEEFLLRHPKVKEAHVVGVPDQARGEVGAACLLLHPGTTSTIEEIKQFCKGCIANYKIPQYVLFMESSEYPRTASGKVPKRELKLQIMEKLGLEVQEEDTDLEYID